MAVNPMQRRTRNSFLLGLLLGFVVVTAVVVLFYSKLQQVQGELDNVISLQRRVYVAADYIQSGSEVNTTVLKQDTVQSTIQEDEIINDAYLTFTDSEGNEFIDESGNIVQKKFLAKTNIPAGSIITKDMLEIEEEKLTNDLRVQEYNMIILPTLLKNGDYIDVRLRLPTGEDYVVVSKKKVVSCTEESVWLVLSEEEILSLGNAIVEAYAINGSKLYATTYEEAGRQKAATPTYPVSAVVLGLINSDPNVRETARTALWNRYYDQEQAEQRNNHINTALSPYYDSMGAHVETGLTEEIKKIQDARKNYVQALEGTGEIGTGVE